MKARLSIGIDLDGVCASFTPSFRRLSVEMFGLPLPEAAMYNRSYDYADWGLSLDQVGAVFKRLGQIKNFWESLGKMPGTAELVDASKKHKLYFLTHRREEWGGGRPIELQSARWITSNYDIPHPTVIVSREKGELAKALELDAFIDDKPSMCERVYQTAPSCKNSTYIRDAAYNQDEQRFIRVKDLDTMLRRLS